jgi:hypothetical protein
MDDIKISIELCVEATSESAARHYAVTHGVDTSAAKWSPDHDGKGRGKLYASTSTPFARVVQSQQPDICSNNGFVYTLCAKPAHKILFRGIHHTEW